MCFRIEAIQMNFHIQKNFFFSNFHGQKLKQKTGVRNQLGSVDSLWMYGKGYILSAIPSELNLSYFKLNYWLQAKSWG